MKKPLALLAAALVSACGSDADDPPAPPDTNGTFATATPIASGVSTVATVASGVDWDFYALTVPAGGAPVRIRTFDRSGAGCDRASEVDTYVEVYDPAHALVTASDDSGVGGCEDLTVPLPAGTSYVVVSGYPPYPLVYTVEVTIP